MSQAQRLENAAIRQWAAAQGLDLGQRGRIADELRERYHTEVGAEARRRWSETVSNDGQEPAPLVPVPAS